MEKSQIILFAAVASFVAIRLYQKYIKKDQKPSDSKKSTRSDFGSSDKEDDYEPYSKK
jgi:hypothetical protein